MGWVEIPCAAGDDRGGYGVPFGFSQGRLVSGSLFGAEVCNFEQSSHFGNGTIGLLRRGGVQRGDSLFWGRHGLALAVGRI
jgi:hypothetical protein